MDHPGRLASFVVERQTRCPACGAEFVEHRRGGVSVLACPWATLPRDVEAGEVSCGKPYARPERDQAHDYVRDQSRRTRP